MDSDASEPDIVLEAHTEAFRCPLRFTPAASQQIPYVPGQRGISTR
jgi:hypothetical protein